MTLLAAAQVGATRWGRLGQRTWASLACFPVLGLSTQTARSRSVRSFVRFSQKAMARSLLHAR
jgi:hypothetical protein